jgi:hypothetical protein
MECNFGLARKIFGVLETSKGYKTFGVLETSKVNKTFEVLETSNVSQDLRGFGNPKGH